MASTLILLVICALSWCRVELGFGIFILLQTPLRNVGGSLVFHLLDMCVLLTVVARLITRKKEPNQDATVGFTEVCAIALSAVVLIRYLEFSPGGFELSSLIRCAFAPTLYGPLLVALGRLNRDEFGRLRGYMALCTAVIGIWGAIIYFTNSSYFIKTSIWGDLETSSAVARMKSSDSSELVKGRMAVMGLYTVLPYGVYYLIWEVFRRLRQSLTTATASLLAVALAFLTVGLSVTRSLLILMVSSLTFVFLAVIISRGVEPKTKARAIAFAIIGTLLMLFLSSRLDLTPIVEQFQLRFGLFTTGDIGADQRIQNTWSALEYLSGHLCIWGAPGPDPLLTANTSVDCPIILQAWLKFGLVGAVLYLSIWLNALLNLTSAWRLPRLNSEEVLARIILTTSAVCYTYLFIVGFSMHPPEIFFSILFLIETRNLTHTALRSKVNLLEAKHVWEQSVPRKSC